MGVTPPYLYQPPSHQGSHLDPQYDFDPKAVTRASWSTVSSPRPKPTGPLIDFNRHPDSYVIIPYGNNQLPPLPARTKKTIIVTRWIQFGLRILQLIGALGLLVCVICIRGVDDVQSWILRIPPAWDACIAAYAIFHLFRPASARTPLSSSTYHAFALFMDLGLIPFMVVSAFFAENNWSMDDGDDGRWRSFFSAKGATDTLLFVTWIVAIAMGGLHLISAAIDVYLIIIFRKIAQYPPDCNPLEDNLTSRAARKHKYKNSEVVVSEKKFASMSGSTLALSRPTSANVGNEKLIPDANVRPISFYQSRTDMNHDYSGHTQETARMSRVNLYQYEQPNSARSSRTDIGGRSPASRPHSRSRSHSRHRSQSSRPNSFTGQSMSGYQGQHDPMPTSPHSFLDRPSRYGTPLTAPQASLPANVAKLQQKDSLLSDNWYVVADDEQGDLSSPRRTPIPEVSWARDLDDDNVLHVDSHNPHAAELSHYAQEERDLLPQPLKTHPPTPPSHGQPKSQLSYANIHSDMTDIHDDTDDGASFKTASTAKDNGAFYFSDMTPGSLQLDMYGNSHATSECHNNDTNSAHNSEGTIGRALTIKSAISAVSSLYSQGNTPDLSRSTSPKRKVYGDLASASKNIRGFSPVGNLPIPPPKHPGRGKSHERSGDHVSQKGPQHSGGRVISRTGVDLADANIMYVDHSPASSSLRGRQVSGKVAEEGLAGAKSAWWGSGNAMGGVRKREVSGAA